MTLFCIISTVHFQKSNWCQEEATCKLMHQHNITAWWTAYLWVLRCVTKLKTHTQHHCASRIGWPAQSTDCVIYKVILGKLPLYPCMHCCEKILTPFLICHTEIMITEGKILSNSTWPYVRKHLPPLFLFNRLASSSLLITPMITFRPVKSQYPLNRACLYRRKLKDCKKQHVMTQTKRTRKNSLKFYERVTQLFLRLLECKPQWEN